MSSGRPRLWPLGPRRHLLVPVLIWAVLSPCGLVHLYAGRWRVGLAMVAVYLTSAWALAEDHTLAMLPMITVYVFDLIAGSQAVLDHNARLRASVGKPFRSAGGA